MGTGAFRNKRYQLPLVWKRFLIVLIILISILSVFAFYINLKWRPFLTKQIEEAISTSTDNLYHIHFKKISVNILTGSASLRGIQFTPDLKVYETLIKKGKAPRHLFRISVTNLNLNRINPWKVYFNRDLDAGSIVINRPNVDMIYRKIDTPQDTVMDNRSAYERLSKYLKSIKIQSIAFRDADFRYIDKDARREKITGLKNLNINITGLLIDSASQYDKSKFYYTKDISIRLRDYKYQSPDSLYNYSLQELTASTSKKSARVLGFRIVPRYSAMAFSKKAKKRVERFSIRLDEVSLENINYRLFTNQRKLVASKLRVSNSAVYVFLNTAMKASDEKKIVKLPQQALRDFNLTTLIDTVELNKIRINYSEYNKQSQRRGSIFFNELSGKILNVTNDSTALMKNHFCNAELTCLLMARGRFNFNVNFDLTDPGSAFNYKGNVGFLKMSYLNTATKPLALIEIGAGVVREMEFSGTGNDLGNNGELIIKYNNLKIKILEKSETSSRLKTKNLATMAANILVLESENPSYEGNLRVGRYNYQRGENVSFFNMLWKGIFIGIQQSVGLDEKTQREIKLKLEQLKREKIQRDKRRLDRMIRKEKRDNRK
ncbi:MAG: hypothetical protein ABI390_08825 [Daejeonella sp.]